MTLPEEVKDLRRMCLSMARTASSGLKNPDLPEYSKAFRQGKLSAYLHVARWARKFMANK
jgi:hypothetical protein